MAKISLIGANKFFHDGGDDLFKYFTVPTELNKDDIINTILLRGGEFEVIYSDLDFLQHAIGSWAQRYQETIKRWVDTLALEYNPIENTDRHEDIIDTTDTTGSATASSTTDTTADGNSTNLISAYDQADFTNKDKNVSNTSGSVDSSNSANSTQNVIFHHTNHTHGNIGVTTNQQMVHDELDLRYWNIYNKIAIIFLAEFVIPIY